jgi:hypothetical protein
MPRERVYATSDPTWSAGAGPGDAPGPAATRPGVEVTWHRDGDVVGVATGWLTDESYDEDDPAHRRVSFPYHVWLTRRDVNRLIRDLKRARNVACGADE